MDEILVLIKALIVGSATPHDIGIRLLILITGSLSAIVAVYIKRDIKHYSESLEKMGHNLSKVDHKTLEMTEMLEKYKHEIGELLLRNLEQTRTEYHAMRTTVLTLDNQLGTVSLAIAGLETKIDLTNDNMNLSQGADIKSGMTHLILTLREEIEKNKSIIKGAEVGMNDFMGELKEETERNKRATLGRIIHLEDFTGRYETLLKGLEKALAAKAVKKP